MHFILGVYAFLLNLYPLNFLEEFQEELQAVFAASLQDAGQRGKMEVAAVFMRELLGLPRAILHEHLRQRRKSKMLRNRNARFEFPQGSTSEALAAMGPLLMSILLMGGLSKLISSTHINQVTFLFLALFLILLFVGFIKGLPRWSMPYLGLLLALFSVIQFSQVIANYGRYNRFRGSWILEELMHQINLWSGLTTVVILLILAAAFIPAFSKFRRDWTLLSFLVYGAAPFAVVLSFEEYQIMRTPYIVLTYTAQVLGVWFYLHTKGKWMCFGVLLSAMVLSILILSIGKIIILPHQIWFQTHGPYSWKNETIGPLPMWGWLMVTMLLPSVISLFPRTRKPAEVASPA